MNSNVGIVKRGQKQVNTQFFIADTIAQVLI